ncbi:MAG: hypothetical protein OER87_05430 [Gammaproteobacteria bacterium]|nr:hypothetical protein [Gammaproteobacteria bacterium]
MHVVDRDLRYPGRCSLYHGIILGAGSCIIPCREFTFFANPVSFTPDILDLSPAHLLILSRRAFAAFIVTLIQELK